MANDTALRTVSELYQNIESNDRDINIGAIQVSVRDFAYEQKQQEEENRMEEQTKAESDMHSSTMQRNETTTDGRTQNDDAIKTVDNVQQQKCLVMGPQMGILMQLYIM